MHLRVAGAISRVLEAHHVQVGHCSTERIPLLYVPIACTSSFHNGHKHTPTALQLNLG